MPGEFCAYVSGPVQVRINLRDGEGFQILGYTTEGVDVQHNAFTNPIYSDEYGGNAGPPVERQFMGASIKLSMQIVRGDIALWKKIREMQSSENWSSGAAGTLSNVGGMMTCGNTTMQILLIGSADTAATAASAGAATLATFFNVPNCWFDGPVSYTLASKNSVLSLDLLGLPFTSDTTQSGDGKTYLFTENNHLITNMATYAGTAQTA